MSETMECYNPIPPIPDTGGTSTGSSALSSPCSNNIVKTDLKSQELDLKDCLLNGDVNNFEDYLPNNNLCDNEDAAMDAHHSKEESCESEECGSGERTRDSEGRLKDGDVSSLSQSGWYLFVNILFSCKVKQLLIF